MEIEHCRQIFEGLVQRFDPAGAGDWSAVLQFKISGDKGGDFVITVDDGKCEMSEGVAESPTATVTTTDDTWIGITTGKVNPMMAFTMGKVKVKGTMGDVMKLNNTSIFKR